MTSAPVMSTYISQNLSNIGTTQVRTQANGSDFKSMMDKSMESPKTEAPAKSEAKSLKQDEPVKSEIKTDKPAGTDEKPDVSQKVDKKVTDEKAADTKDIIKKVENTLSDELEVSAEQIEEALSILGLTVAALLDQNMMPQIVAELTGKDDVIDLATDEDIFGKLMTVSTAAEDALAEVSELLDVPEEEIAKAVSMLEKLSAEIETDTEDHPLEAGDDFQKVLATKTTEVAKPQENDSFESKTGVTVEEGYRVNNSNRNNETTVSNQAAEAAAQKAEEGITKVQKSEDSSAFRNDSQTMNFAQTIIAKATEIFNEAAEDSISYSSVEVENIINQLTESIKANISAEVSEINMRLHPETLGTVSVKLSANNEGLLTATFTAQNEEVKAVIESQAIVLKETLEAKGTTVEAIEVLVQSHGFERDLSNQNRGQSDSENGRGRKTVRRINLTEDTPADETADDALVREMMAQNGNTIDYSA